MPRPPPPPYIRDEVISVALQLTDSLPPFKLYNNRDGTSLEQHQTEILDKRYLLCPSSFKVLNLKKFIRLKFELDRSLRIALFHDHDLLSDDMSFMDAAHVSLWTREAPLQVNYIIYSEDDVKENTWLVDAVDLSSSVAHPTSTILTGKKRGRKREETMSNSADRGGKDSQTSCITGVKDDGVEGLCDPQTVVERLDNNEQGTGCVVSPVCSSSNRDIIHDDCDSKKACGEEDVNHQVDDVPPSQQAFHSERGLFSDEIAPPKTQRCECKCSCNSLLKGKSFPIRTGRSSTNSESLGENVDAPQDNTQDGSTNHIRDVTQQEQSSSSSLQYSDTDIHTMQYAQVPPVDNDHSFNADSKTVMNTQFQGSVDVEEPKKGYVKDTAPGKVSSSEVCNTQKDLSAESYQDSPCTNSDPLPYDKACQPVQIPAVPDSHLPTEDTKYPVSNQAPAITATALYENFSQNKVDSKSDQVLSQQPSTGVVALAAVQGKRNVEHPAIQQGPVGLSALGQKTFLIPSNGNTFVLTSQANMVPPAGGAILIPANGNMVVIPQKNLIWSRNPLIGGRTIRLTPSAAGVTLNQANLVPLSTSSRFPNYKQKVSAQALINATLNATVRGMKQRPAKSTGPVAKSTINQILHCIEQSSANVLPVAPDRYQQPAMKASTLPAALGSPIGTSTPLKLETKQVPKNVRDLQSVSASAVTSQENVDSQGIRPQPKNNDYVSPMTVSSTKGYQTNGVSINNAYLDFQTAESGASIPRNTNMVATDTTLLNQHITIEKQAAAALCEISKVVEGNMTSSPDQLPSPILQVSSSQPPSKDVTLQAVHDYTKQPIVTNGIQDYSNQSYAMGSDLGYNKQSVATNGIHGYSKQHAATNGTHEFNKQTAEIKGVNDHNHQIIATKGVHDYNNQPSVANGDHGNNNQPSVANGDHGYNNQPNVANGVHDYNIVSSVANGIPDHKNQAIRTDRANVVNKQPMTTNGYESYHKVNVATNSAHDYNQQSPEVNGAHYGHPPVITNGAHDSNQSIAIESDYRLPITINDTHGHVKQSLATNCGVCIDEKISANQAPPNFDSLISSGIVAKKARIVQTSTGNIDNSQTVKVDLLDANEITSSVRLAQVQSDPHTTAIEPMLVSGLSSEIDICSKIETQIDIPNVNKTDGGFATEVAVEFIGEKTKLPSLSSSSPPIVSVSKVVENVPTPPTCTGVMDTSHEVLYSSVSADTGTQMRIDNVQASGYVQPLQTLDQKADQCVIQTTTSVSDDALLQNNRKLLKILSPTSDYHVTSTGLTGQSQYTLFSSASSEKMLAETSNDLSDENLGQISSLISSNSLYITQIVEASTHTNSVIRKQLDHTTVCEAIKGPVCSPLLLDSNNKYSATTGQTKSDSDPIANLHLYTNSFSSEITKVANGHSIRKTQNVTPSSPGVHEEVDNNATSCSSLSSKVGFITSAMSTNIVAPKSLISPNSVTSNALILPNAVTTKLLMSPNADSSVSLKAPIAGVADPKMSPNASTTNVVMSPRTSASHALMPSNAGTSNKVKSPSAKASTPLISVNSSSSNSLMAHNVGKSTSLVIPTADSSNILMTQPSCSSDSLMFANELSTSVSPVNSAGHNSTNQLNCATITDNIILKDIQTTTSQEMRTEVDTIDQRSKEAVTSIEDGNNLPQSKQSALSSEGHSSASQAGPSNRPAVSMKVNAATNTTDEYIDADAKPKVSSTTDTPSEKNKLLVNAETQTDVEEQQVCLPEKDNDIHHEQSDSPSTSAVCQETEDLQPNTENTTEKKINFQDAVDSKSSNDNTEESSSVSLSYSAEHEGAIALQESRSIAPKTSTVTSMPSSQCVADSSEISIPIDNMPNKSDVAVNEIPQVSLEQVNGKGEDTSSNITSKFDVDHFNQQKVQIDQESSFKEPKKQKKSFALQPLSKPKRKIVSDEKLSKVASSKVGHASYYTKKKDIRNVTQKKSRKRTMTGSLLKPNEFHNTKTILNSFKKDPYEWEDSDSEFTNGPPIKRMFKENRLRVLETNLKNASSRLVSTANNESKNVKRLLKSKLDGSRVVTDNLPLNSAGQEKKQDPTDTKMSNDQLSTNGFIDVDNDSQNIDNDIGCLPPQELPTSTGVKPINTEYIIQDADIDLQVNYMPDAVLETNNNRVVKTEIPLTTSVVVEKQPDSHMIITAPHRKSHQPPKQQYKEANRNAIKANGPSNFPEQQKVSLANSHMPSVAPTELTLSEKAIEKGHGPYHKPLARYQQKQKAYEQALTAKKRKDEEDLSMGLKGKPVPPNADGKELCNGNDNEASNCDQSKPPKVSKKRKKSNSPHGTKGGLVFKYNKKSKHLTPVSVDTIDKKSRNGNSLPSLPADKYAPSETNSVHTNSDTMAKKNQTIQKPSMSAEETCDQHPLLQLATLTDAQRPLPVPQKIATSMAPPNTVPLKKRPKTMFEFGSHPTGSEVDNAKQREMNTSQAKEVHIHQSHGYMTTPVVTTTAECSNGNSELQKRTSPQLKTQPFPMMVRPTPLLTSATEQQPAVLKGSSTSSTPILICQSVSSAHTSAATNSRLPLIYPKPPAPQGTTLFLGVGARHVMPPQISYHGVIMLNGGKQVTTPTSTTVVFPQGPLGKVVEKTAQPSPEALNTVRIPTLATRVGPRETRDVNGKAEAVSRSTQFCESTAPIPITNASVSRMNESENGMKSQLTKTVEKGKLFHIATQPSMAPFTNGSSNGATSKNNWGHVTYTSQHNLVSRAVTIVESRSAANVASDSDRAKAQLRAIEQAQRKRSKYS